eukprot:4929814-Alexandrium_andersonii.AAC.1
MREAVPQRRPIQIPDSQRGVQAAVHLRRPHPVAHELPKLAPVLAGGFSEQALEARTAVKAHQVLSQQLPGMLHEPEHSR